MPEYATNADRTVSAPLEDALESYEAYRAALDALFETLNVVGSECRGGPEGAIANAVVASIEGGAVVPQSQHEPYGVLGPTGSRVSVQPISEGGGLMGGFIQMPERERNWDELAIVVFAERRPRVVHFIPSERLPEVARVLGVLPGGRIVFDQFQAANLMLEPVIAAALGVRTVLL
jgi:hypothetical protein